MPSTSTTLCLGSELIVTCIELKELQPRPSPEGLVNLGPRASQIGWGVGGL